jgi:hypothetical protein
MFLNRTSGCPTHLPSKERFRSVEPVVELSTALNRIDRRLIAVVVVVLVAGAIGGGLARSDDDDAAGGGGSAGPGLARPFDDDGRPPGARPSDRSGTSATSTTAAPTTASSDPPAGGSEDGPPAGAPDDIDPASPPATGPPGVQGAVRAQPCTPTGPPTEPLPLRDGFAIGAGSWVTVARLEGNCGGTSPSFKASGKDARLLYRSDAEQLVAFIDDVDDPDRAAGYADVECRSRCADEQLLTISSGRYRLRVEATDGPWEVLVQEYR